MKIIKIILIFILTIFVFANPLQITYCKTITKEVEVQTKDSKIIKATLSYIKIEGIEKYPTVLLLHSLGYSSNEWGNLITDLNNAGYLVIAMDLRGHGKSVYDMKFRKKSWAYFSSKIYQKFPGDAIAILNQAQKRFKLADLNNLAIVGADIGANTAVLTAKELKKKPKTLVLISPTRSFKGLYIPVAMTELNIPILSMVSTKDRLCLKEQKNLAKFSQGGFYAKNYPRGGMGMLMLKTNPSMSQDIVKWIIKYLK